MLPEQARGLGPSAVAMGTDCGGTAAGGAVAAPCGMVSFLIAALLAAYSALHWLPVLTSPLVLTIARGQRGRRRCKHAFSFVRVAGRKSSK